MPGRNLTVLTIGVAAGALLYHLSLTRAGVSGAGARR